MDDGERGRVSCKKREREERNEREKTSKKNREKEERSDSRMKRNPNFQQNAKKKQLFTHSPPPTSPLPPALLLLLLQQAPHHAPHVEPLEIDIRLPAAHEHHRGPGGVNHADTAAPTLSSIVSNFVKTMPSTAQGRPFPDRRRPRRSLRRCRWLPLSALAISCCSSGEPIPTVGR